MRPRAPRFGLPRHRRLRRTNDFSRTERQGRRAHGALVTLVGRRGATRVGFTVSKKVGNAVVRNVVKRRLRDILRRHPALWLGADLIVIAKPTAAGKDLAALEADVLLAFSRFDTPAPSSSNQRGPHAQKTR